MTYSLARLPIPANDNPAPWGEDHIIAFWFGGYEVF